jgi:hypothetical protein
MYQFNANGNPEGAYPEVAAEKHKSSDINPKYANENQSDADAIPAKSDDKPKGGIKPADGNSAGKGGNSAGADGNPNDAKSENPPPHNKQSNRQSSATDSAAKRKSGEKVSTSFKLNGNIADAIPKQARKYGLSNSEYVAALIHCDVTSEKMETFLDSYRRFKNVF